MEVDGNALEEFLQFVGPSIGDRRTAHTIRGVVEGIIGGESLRCSQIAAFSPHI